MFYKAGSDVGPARRAINNAIVVFSVRRSNTSRLCTAIRCVSLLYIFNSYDIVISNHSEFLFVICAKYKYCGSGVWLLDHTALHDMPSLQINCYFCTDWDYPNRVTHFSNYAVRHKFSRW